MATDRYQFGVSGACAYDLDVSVCLHRSGGDGGGEGVVAALLLGQYELRVLPGRQQGGRLGHAGRAYVPSDGGAGVGHVDLCQGGGIVEVYRQGLCQLPYDGFVALQVDGSDACHGLGQ